MKKVIAMTLSAILMLGMFAGCAEKKPVIDADAEVKDDSIGVVLVVNTNLGDKSFCDLSYQGLQRAETELGVRIKVVELGGDATKQVPTFTEFAESDDWDIIVSGTYNVAESMMEVAEQYHNKQFILYDAAGDYEAYDIPNLYSVEHLQNEGSFLVGACAGILTTSDNERANEENIIGFVAGGENSSINDFLVGYIQGAQAISEDIEVLISYIGDFKDSAKGKEMSIAQINQGADVIFQVAAMAGLGVIDGAKEQGAYAIGVDQDQAITFEETDAEISEIIATSMVKFVDNTVFNAIKGAVDGTLEFGTADKVGLADGSVGIARNKYYDALFTDEEKAIIDDLEQKIVSGEIVVDSALDMSTEDMQAIKDSVRP